jgi:glucosamine-6-phosphate deaminase
MDITISTDKNGLGQRASKEGASLIRQAIAQQGQATIIVATGASQFEMLSALIEQPDIDWSRITAFHLDEYIGMPSTHPASFRKYLKERLVDKVPIGTFHYINGEDNAQAECDRLAPLINAQPIDVAFMGIGENGHLAFNDPPADFETEEAYLIVDLDEDCRKQQLGEGWFATLEDVPQQAISMSIRQIMKSKHIVCSVPDQRKATAVQATVEGPITPQVPASILQQHPQTSLYLDQASASLLKNE